MFPASSLHFTLLSLLWEFAVVVGVKMEIKVGEKKGSQSGVSGLLQGHGGFACGKNCFELEASEPFYSQFWCMLKILAHLANPIWRSCCPKFLPRGLSCWGTLSTDIKWAIFEGLVATKPAIAKYSKHQVGVYGHGIAGNCTERLLSISVLVVGSLQSEQRECLLNNISSVSW